MQKSGPAPAHRCRPTFISKRLGRMSQCRQASDPAAGVSDLSGPAGFTVTHSQGLAPYSACPAARGRPLDLLFSFRRGLPPFRMFRHLSVYHSNFPLARGISAVSPSRAHFPPLLSTQKLRPTQKLPAPEPSPQRREPFSLFIGSLTSPLPWYWHCPWVQEPH